jgi:hypothetical protein
MKKFIAVAIASLAVVVLSACGEGVPGPDGIEGDPVAPVTKTATNVEMVKVPGSVGFPEGVIVFDMERDGQILTCTTKNNYNSGVSCLAKAEK